MSGYNCVCSCFFIYVKEKTIWCTFNSTHIYMHNDSERYNEQIMYKHTGVNARVACCLFRKILLSYFYRRCFKLRGCCKWLQVVFEELMQLYDQVHRRSSSSLPVIDYLDWNMQLYKSKREWKFCTLSEMKTLVIIFLTISMYYFTDADLFQAGRVPSLST